MERRRGEENRKREGERRTSAAPLMYSAWPAKRPWGCGFGWFWGLVPLLVGVDSDMALVLIGEARMSVFWFQFNLVDDHF